MSLRAANPTPLPCVGSCTATTAYTTSEGVGADDEVDSEAVGGTDDELVAGTDDVAGEETGADVDVDGTDVDVTGTDVGLVGADVGLVEVAGADVGV